MEQVTINDKYVILPPHIISKLIGKNINILEVEEGILLKISDSDPISRVRGILKGTNVSSEKYMQSKKLEKELDL